MSPFVQLLLGLAAVVTIGGVYATRALDRSAAETPPNAAPQNVAQQNIASVAKPSVARPVEQPPSGGYGSVTLDPGPGGHYHADVEIYGRRLPMLVDTGATIIALTEADARSIGIHPSPSDYTIPISTANGVARAAPVMLREVRIRTISIYDVQAVVMPRNVMGRSLLGMSFLKKLRGFEIASGKMVLRQ